VLRVLILGGTTEGSALAQALDGDARVHATLSLAGVTRAPALPRIATRIGGFGGADGLAAWLRDTATTVLIDATHPFAQQISRNAVAAAAIAPATLLRVARPEWRAAPGDRWTLVPDMETAAARLGPMPRRVLLTIGRKDLAPFRDHPQHHYLVRSVDAPPPELLPHTCALITARGPFRLEDELSLLSRHRIDTIVTKNSGGSATAPKLDAARRLGLDVVMVARPPPVPAPHVPNWQDALRWLEACHLAPPALHAI
jgi:precorrin-6A/cobalt-precorrin-6A reductase